MKRPPSNEPPPPPRTDVRNQGLSWAYDHPLAPEYPSDLEAFAALHGFGPEDAA